MTTVERGMSSCLPPSLFQWISSAGLKRTGRHLRAAGESTGSRTLHSSEGREKKQSKLLLTRVQLPGHFISIVCIVLFVLWSARSSLPSVNICAEPHPAPCQPLLPTRGGSRSLTPFARSSSQHPLLTGRDLPHLAEELQH